MATVGEIDGLRVVIYSNDHRLAHVHVIGAGCEAVFKLNCPEGQPELREDYGFTTRKLSRFTFSISRMRWCRCGRRRESGYLFKQEEVEL